MDTIRKRPAPPHEPCDTAPETNGVAKPDIPAQPLDLLLPLDASLPQVSENPSSGEARDPLPTYPPLFKRIRPKPRRLSAPASVSAPDWKLSTGAAVVLLGFAIAFGTYITLTERDAMQSRLRRIVGQNELRAAPRHDRASITDRTQELARTLREQIEALRSRDATDAAIVASAATHTTANAHTSMLPSRSPRLPPTSTAASSSASHSKTPAKPLAPPLPQPAPHTRPVASVAPMRPHGTPSSPKPEHQAAAKQTTMQSTSKLVKVASKTAPPKVATKARPTRPAVAKAPVKPVPRTVPATVQASTPPDQTATLPASDDTQIYRQH